MNSNKNQLALINASEFHSRSSHELTYYTPQNEYLNISCFQEAMQTKIYNKKFQPFVYVIVNSGFSECLLVRDHLGEQPLFYYFQDGVLIFGETIADILRQLSQSPVLMDSAIEDLFADVYSYTHKTLYKNIYRVEPGCMLHIFPDGKTIKKIYWQLEPVGETLSYRKDEEYLEQFTDLMQTSIKNATRGRLRIAAEFSAGMDSTAIYATCASLGMNPTLFMHTPHNTSENRLTYNTQYEQLFKKQFPLATIQYIEARELNLFSILKEYVNWLGVPSAYMFELFAHPFHQAVSQQGHKILLSGFGGDQGISSPVPVRFLLSSLIKNKQFAKAWLELEPQNWIRRCFLILQYTHPLNHQWLQQLQDIKIKFKNGFKKANQRYLISHYPYHRTYFKTLREAEWSFLQGPNSHEIRMRIETSHIVAKKMGFEYRYPLLYPPLLEFFLSLPWEQKRRHGVGRYLMQCYLKSTMPMVPFDQYQKKEGLHILPTLEIFREQWEKGFYHADFQSLPFKDRMKSSSSYQKMIKHVQGIMLNECMRLYGIQ